MSYGHHQTYHIAQDAFIVFVFIWVAMKTWDFSFIKSLLSIALWIMLFKTILIYLLPIDLAWGSGDFLDGNFFDFGLYKRIQIKGGDSLLMIYPFFHSIRRVTPTTIAFFILLIFSGSRALIAYTLMILIIESNFSVVQWLKSIFLVLTVLVVMFGVLNFQSRFEEDGGRGQSWRLLETAIVLEEIKGNWLVGNGLGAGFKMPVASGSTLAGGVNLYTHNVFSWLLLKGGLVFVGVFLIILYKNFYRLTSRMKIMMLLLIALNLVNNYISTFSGILLFSLYLSYVKVQRKN